MKNLIYLLLLIYSFPSLAQISIISDLDDTIKITEAGGDATDMVGDDVFAGMSEFFKGTKTYSVSLHILSASPSFMSPIIKRTLKKRGIDYQSLVLRNDVTEDKFEYKVRKIKEIFDSTNDVFILIGDDLGKDPEAYAEIKKLFPERVLEIYIHVVNGRPINSDAVPYWTSFDLFLREYISGRMNSGWVENIIRKFFEYKNLSMVFPEKADCPKSPLIYAWQLESHYQEESMDLSDRFVKFCLQRQSDNILP